VISVARRVGGTEFSGIGSGWGSREVNGDSMGQVMSTRDMGGMSTYLPNCGGTASQTSWLVRPLQEMCRTNGVGE
jgi:hypothetical protein